MIVLRHILGGGQMSSKRIPEIGVVLILYNREQLAIKRFEELKKLTKLGIRLYVSIDATPSSDHLVDSNADLIGYATSLEPEMNVATYVEEINQGCDRHIPRAISRVLEECEAVFVIEDDVKMSVSAIQKSISKMTAVLKSNEMQPVISMSGLTRTLWSQKNPWRRTPYFSPWGFGINRKFWRAHLELEEERKRKSNFQLETPKSSYYWSLGGRRKFIWNERCFRGNYDYSIQATLFQLGLDSIAPTLRIADNEGFGGLDSTHTRFGKPRFLKIDSRRVSEFSLTSELTCRICAKFLVYLDSITWAGDSLISKRGRIVGLRSLLRNPRLSLKRYARN